MSIFGRVNLGRSTLLGIALLVGGLCLAAWPLACAIHELARAIERR